MTDRLYHIDPYMKEFEAILLDAMQKAEGNAVVLDRSCFYPEGGGQPCDLGWIADAAVVKVLEEGGVILHFVDRSPKEKGCKVRGHIDWGRRFDHMQQHTGQHILSQAFLRTLGCDTISFHLGSEYSTIDLKVEALTQEAIYKAEDMANDVIYQNRKINCFLWGEGSAHGVAVRGQPPAEGDTRVIAIDVFDYSFCGGTHCSKTGEVGIIKVRRWEKAKGNVRVEFLCGYRALRDYRAKNRWLFDISRELGVGEAEAVERLRKRVEENKELRHELDSVVETMLEMEAKRLAHEAGEVRSVKVITRVFSGREVKEVKRLADKLQAVGNYVALFGVANESATMIFSCSPNLGLDMGALMTMAAPLVGGKGGGKPERAQGGGPLVVNLEEAIRAAEVMLRKQMGA